MSESGKGRGTIEKVRKLVLPIAADLGLDLWDVRFLKEGANWYLRIFIDNPNGITIEDCERLSRAIDKPLDELDPISQSYCLEVSSPGIERELVNPEHFEKFLESDVKVKLIRPLMDGLREFAGKLKSFKNGEIIICLPDGNLINVLKKDTAYIKLDDFKNNRGYL